MTAGVLVSTLCWTTPVEAIGGGEPGSTPGLARLDVEGVPRCSASLVRPNWALTAAHCLGAGVVTIVTPLGSRTVAEAVVHPGFEAATPTSSADLALLRLATASSEPVAVLASAGQAAVVGDTVTLAGWGLLDDDTAPTVSHIGAAIVAEVGTDIAGMFTTSGGAAGCSGDSGGPAFVAGRLVGVMSASVAAECGAANLWVDLAAQRGWVDGVLGRDGAAPSVTGGSLITPVDIPIEFTVDVTDERVLVIGDEITFIVSGGVVDNCDSTTDRETCRFTPTSGFQGEATVDVVAFDGTSIGTGSWTIFVGEGTVNQPPVFTPVPPLTSADGEPVSFSLDVVDPDGNVLTLDDITITSNGGTAVCAGELPATCTFTPSATFTGSGRVFATVSDGGENYTLIVRIAVRINLPPVVASGSITVDAGDSFEITFSAFDDRLGELGIDNLFEVQLGVFTDSDYSCDAELVPVVCRFPTAVGRSFQETITVTFTDGVNESTGTWLVDVVSTNRAPVVSSPSPDQVFTVVEGFPFEIPLSYSDPDGDSIEAGAVRVDLAVEAFGCDPDGTSLVCRFHAPLAGDEVLVGTVSVSDPFGQTTEVPFVVKVEPWTGPRITVEDVSVAEPRKGRQRVSIVLQLDQPAPRAVSVAVQPDLAGSTVTDADVTADDATLTFRRGSTRATYTFVVRSDAAEEDVEFLALRLASDLVALSTRTLNVIVNPT